MRSNAQLTKKWKEEDADYWLNTVENLTLLPGKQNTKRNPTLQGRYGCDYDHPEPPLVRCERLCIKPGGEGTRQG